MRLQIMDGNVHAVQKKHPHSRSAWVCQDIRCIQTILKQPKRLLRSLGKKKKAHTDTKTKPMIEFKVTALIISMRYWILQRIQQYLYALHCGGFLEYYTINPPKNAFIWAQKNKKMPKQNCDKVLKYWVYTNKEFAKSPKKEYATVEEFTTFKYFPVAPTQHCFNFTLSTEEPDHTTVSNISENTITLPNLPYEKTSVFTRIYEEYTKANDSTHLYHVIGITKQKVTSSFFTYIEIFEHLQGLAKNT